MCEENSYGEEPTYEYVEHLRKWGKRDWPPRWYLFGFRILPLTLLSSFWAAIDAGLFPLSEGGAAVAKLDTYFMSAASVYLIHVYFHIPRYGRTDLPDSRWEQIRSFPKTFAELIGLACLPVAGLALDWVSGLPISFTLWAVAAILVIWWCVVGTKGRLFYQYVNSDCDQVATMDLPLARRVWDLAKCHYRLVLDDWERATMHLSRRRQKAWEFVRRHYCLALAGVVFVVSLTPLSGLLGSRLFANVVAVELIVGVIVAVIAVFDDLRLRRLRADTREAR